MTTDVVKCPLGAKSLQCRGPALPHGSLAACRADRTPWELLGPLASEPLGRGPDIISNIPQNTGDQLVNTLEPLDHTKDKLQCVPLVIVAIKIAPGGGGWESWMELLSTSPSWQLGATRFLTLEPAVHKGPGGA